MTFDKRYWEQHWQGSTGEHPPNPHLVAEAGGLAPGTALDAGCGTGAEAIWLASRGWQVTAADISSEALARAAERATANGVSERLRWVEADLGAWAPDTRFDLVTTHYAAAASPLEREPVSTNLSSPADATIEDPRRRWSMSLAR
ncbi:MULTISPECIES: SAM-dependent methyltransferase [unclassified Saccharothrix]|uniref:SAM-dependent methyltransferase n=1 Tax=unclassified Saccharothrix TaxID=2593673 RepID=UPI00307DFA70